MGSPADRRLGRAATIAPGHARRLDVDGDVAGAGAAVDSEGGIGLRRVTAFAELENNRSANARI